MTEKEEILRQISSLAEQGGISRQEILKAYNDGLEKAAPSGSSISIAAAGDAVPAAPVPKRPSFMKQISIVDILFYIGGAIIFLGLVFMVAQNWSTLGVAPRVLVTLGGGIAAYYVGFVLMRDERTERMAPAFFLISALIIPVGIYVVFDSAGFKASSYGYQTIISGMMLAAFLASYFLYRRSIFVLFSILYGTWLFFSLTSYLMLNDGATFDEEDFYLYRALVAGLTYLVLGHAFSRTEHAPISGYLNNFGLVGFLGAALALGGWKPDQKMYWEAVYPGLVFGALFLSVRLRSRAYLAWGSIFLMLFLIKTTNEYFPSGMGWPTALVITGLLLIGVGYMTLSIKRKYISV